MEVIWKDIVGYEGIYQVSSDGDVMSLPKYIKSKNGSFAYRKSKLMCLNTDKNGYKTINLWKDGIRKTHKIHRLSMIAFTKNENKYTQVNHINGIKHDNRIENLEWCNSSQNQIHAFKFGLQKKKLGDSHANSKLKSSDISKIKMLHANGERQKNIAKMFGVSRPAISAVISGLTWSHIK